MWTPLSIQRRALQPLYKLCLPSEFEGGEFVVSRQGETKVFDWAKKSSTQEIQWASVGVIEQENWMCCISRPTKRSRKVFAFTQEDLEYLNDPTGRPKPFHGVRAPMPFLLVSRGEILTYSHDEGAEYTSNSSSPERTDANYYQAALIIHKPRKGRVCSLFRICKAVISWHIPLAEAELESLPEELLK